MAPKPCGGRRGALVSAAVLRPLSCAVAAVMSQPRHPSATSVGCNCRNTPVHFAHPCPDLRSKFCEGLETTSSFIFQQHKSAPDFISWSLRQPRPASPPRLGGCHDSSFGYCSWWGGALAQAAEHLSHRALRHSLMRRHHNHSALVVSPSSLAVSLHSILLAPRTHNLSMGS